MEIATAVANGLSTRVQITNMDNGDIFHTVYPADPAREEVEAAREDSTPYDDGLTIPDIPRDLVMLVIGSRLSIPMGEGAGPAIARRLGQPIAMVDAKTFEVRQVFQPPTRRIRKSRG